MNVATLVESFYVIIRVATTECFKMQMVINLAQVSFRNKKVNFYTCSRLTFLKKKCHCGKCLKERCVCRQTPLAARAFGARNLPGPAFVVQVRVGVEMLGDITFHKATLQSRVNIVFTSSCSEVWLRP